MFSFIFYLLISQSNKNIQFKYEYINGPKWDFSLLNLRVLTKGFLSAPSNPQTRIKPNTYTSIYVLIIIFVDSELGINIFNPLLILIPHSQVLGPKAIISLSDPCQQNHHQNRTDLNKWSPKACRVFLSLHLKSPPPSVDLSIYLWYYLKSRI